MRLSKRQRREIAQAAAERLASEVIEEIEDEFAGELPPAEVDPKRKIVPLDPDNEVDGFATELPPAEASRGRENLRVSPLFDRPGESHYLQGIEMFKELAASGCRLTVSAHEFAEDHRAEMLRRERRTRE